MRLLGVVVGIGFERDLPRVCSLILVSVLISARTERERRSAPKGLESNGLGRLGGLRRKGARNLVRVVPNVNVQLGLVMERKAPT